MSEVSPQLPSRGPLDQAPRRISVELPFRHLAVRDVLLHLDISSLRLSSRVLRRLCTQYREYLEYAALTPRAQHGYVLQMRLRLRPIRNPYFRAHSALPLPLPRLSQTISKRLRNVCDIPVL